MTRSFLRSAAALLLAAVITLAPAAPAYGQLKRGPDYSRGKSQFPNLLAPYSPIYVPPPNLDNTPRIGQMIQDGKLNLSLEDAISLALEDNLDISVQRYNPWISDTDILRTKAGGAARGLAGTGTASALGNIPSASFDPVFSASVSLDHRNIPVNNPFLSGTGVALTALTNHSVQANFQYSQAFHTGTAISVTQDNSRVSTTSPASLFNPSIQSTLFFGFSQQLLNGFGLLPNTRFIRIAKNNKRISDLNFEQQVITTVTQVENLYWELVFARENVKVQQRSVDLAEKLYSDNKKQVEIGTLAPIEVVRAEAQVASAHQALIVAQTAQLQQQTLLLAAITKDPLAPPLQGLEIIPTDSVSKPPEVQVKPLTEAVQEALSKRPDYQQLLVDLKNRKINVSGTRNALLPILTLFGQYGWTGLAGNSLIPGATTGAFTPILTSPIVDATGTPTGAFLSSPVRSPSTSSRSGLSDSFNAIVSNDFPTYSLQLSLSIPIRNRSAQADNARALLEERQAQVRIKQVQSNVAVDVRNAEISLEQNRARVDAAVKTRILQEQTLDAEQKKYQLGASTVFLVVQAQRDLATAASAEVRALVDYMEAKVNYERSLGRTLEVNRITLANAKSGQLPRETLIPGTSVTGELVGVGKK